MDFNRITLTDAATLTAQWATPHEERVRDYLNDHLLGKPGVLNDISYWTGPMLPVGHPNYPSMRESLTRAFVAGNVFRQAVEQFAESVTGLDQWQLTPAGQARTEAAPTPTEQDVTAWWDRTGIEGILDQFKVRLTAHGRAPLRPVLTASALQRDPERGTVTLRPARTLAEALSRIRVRLPDLTQAGLYEDPDTLDTVSVYHYSVQGRNELELSWVLPDGRTVLKQVRERGAPQVATLDLGGRHWMVEARLPRGVASPSMLSNQDALGVSDTMLNRNTHFAGYVEVYAIGVAPPGRWEAEGGTPVQPGTPGARWVPAPVTTGPGTRNFYQPSERTSTTTDAEGNTTQSTVFAKPEIGRFTPVEPLAIQAGIARFEGNIYREARQAFMLMNDKASASGYSRVVAAGSFTTGGGKLKRAAEQATRDLLELVLHIAALMLPPQQAAELRALRATVNARVIAFKPSDAERQQNREDYAAGGIDWETYALGTGLITDPDVTRARIQADAAARASPQDNPGGEDA